MKKLITNLIKGLIFVLFSTTVSAQPTLSVSPSSTLANTGDTITVTVKASNFLDIVSFQYSMQWNPLVLKFISLDSFSTDLPGLNAASFGASPNNVDNGKLTVSWLDNNLTGVTVPDNTCLYSLSFAVLTTALGTDMLLSGTPTAIEFTDPNGLVNGVVLVKGTVNGGGPIDGTPPANLTLSASNGSGVNGDVACVDITVDNFTNIDSLQFSMNFDPAVVQFLSLQNFNLQSLDFGDFNFSQTAAGLLSLSWTDALGSGVTIPDGTVIFQVCLSLVGTDGQSSSFDFTGNPTAIHAVDGSGASLIMDSNSGLISITGGNNQASVTFAASTKDAQNGELVCLNVSVADFTNILSFQYSMNFDPAVLQFTNLQNFNLAGLTVANFGLADSGNGNLTVSWADPNTAGLTIPDGTVIFQVCFTVIGTSGQSSNFAFSGNPTAIEVMDGGANPVLLNGNSGAVNVLAPPPQTVLSVSAPTLNAQTGDMVCLDITTGSFDNILSFQYSMNFDPAVLQFVSVQGFNLAGLTAANFGAGDAANGNLTVSWFDQNAMGVTLPNGTVLYQVCFTVIGNGGTSSDFSFSGNPMAIQVVDGGSNAGTLNSTAGAVNVTGGGGPTAFSINAPTVNAMNGDMICLDITADGFDNIVSFQYSMNFDPAVLQFESVQGFNLAGLTAANFGTAGTGSGNLTVSWFDQNVTGVTLPNGTVLYQVCFTVIGSGGTSSNFTFSGNPTGIEVVEGGGGMVTFSSTAGAVNVTGGGGGGPTAFSINAPTVNAMNGDMICLDITADGFDNIVSFQYSMNFDPAVLQFESVQGFNLAGLTAANFGTADAGSGNLTVSWFDQNVTGVTLPNGTVLYQVCFTVIGGGGTSSDFTFSGNPTSIEVIDGNSNPVTFSSTGGAVNVTGGGGPTAFSINAPTLNAQTGDMICLDITADGFDNIVSFQYSMNFDPAVLQFVSVQGFNLAGLTAANFGTADAGSGNLTVSWFDQNVTGVTLPNGTVLYQVCFTVIGGGGTSSDFTFSGNPTTIEVVEGGGGMVTFGSTVGAVNVLPDNGDPLPFSINAPTVNAMNGDMICLDITADGFDNILSFQYSMNFDPAVLQFEGVQGFNLAGLTAANFGTAGAGSGNLTVSWFDQNVTGVTLPNGTVLYQVCFTVIGGGGTSSSFTFSGNPTAIEVIDGNSAAVTFSSAAGFVNVVGGGLNGFTVIAPDVTIAPGTQFCLPVTVNDFNDILSMQYSMNYDPSKLQFDMVQGFNLPSLDANNFNSAPGVVNISWNDPGLNGITLANGDAIYEVCFTAIGLSACGNPTSFSFSGNPTPIEVFDGAQNAVPFNSIGSDVTICGDNPPGAFMLIASRDTVEKGDLVCIDVSVEGFTNIVSMQYSMNFDPEVLEFTQIQGLNLSDLTLANFNSEGTSGGNITFSWFDQNTTGVTLPDGTIIYQVCFNAIGDNGQASSFDFSGDPTALEVTNNGGIIQAGLSNGFVSIKEFIPCGGPIAVTSALVTDVPCNGEATGAIDITVSGGNQTYNFTWKDAGGTVISNAEDLANVPAGTVALSISSCGGVETFSQSYSINEPATPISLGIDAAAPLCFGDQTASITTTVSGGIPNYAYNWNTGATTPNLTAMPAGVYALTVTDAGGCTSVSGPIVVTQPAELTATVTATDAICNGDATGTITLNATGGTPPLEYRINDVNNGPWQPSNNFNGLLATTYTGEVRDANGCIFQMPNIIVGQPPVMEITSFQVANTTSACDGSIQMTVSGGNGGYSYVWTGPDNFTSTQQNIFNLCAGEYCVTVTDQSGDCTVEQCAFVSIPLVIAAPALQHACFGVCNGSIDLPVTGGIPPFNYSFAWSNGSTTQNQMDLCAGDYTVTVTSLPDGQQQTQTLTVEAATDPVQIINEQIQNPSLPDVCDGTISLMATGGFGAPYTYLWDPVLPNAPGASGLCDGTYNLTVQDANGCSISASFQLAFNPDDLLFTTTEATPANCSDSEDGELSILLEGGLLPYTVTVAGPVNTTFTENDHQILLTNLPAGQYEITIVDNAPGDLQQTISQTVMVDAPVPLSIEPVKVFNATEAQLGRIDITPSGGTAPYDFVWSNAFPGQNPSDLAPGQYDVTITDNHGCIKIINNIEVRLFKINDVAAIQNVFCSSDSDGIIDITLEGANGPLTFSWTGPDGFTFDGEDLNNAPAGTYSVVATDTLGVSTVAKEFTIQAESNISVSASPLTNFNGFNVSCNGFADAGAVATPLQGQEPFIFMWNNGATGPVLSNVPAGTYAVTIIDSQGCESTASVELTEPMELISNPTTAPVSCFGGQNGRAELSPVGGVLVGPDYTYQWDDPLGQTTRIASSLSSGTYHVTVTDGNGCTLEDALTVSEPDSIMVTVTTTVDEGGPNGTATALATGGTPPYTYQWNFQNKTDQGITGLLPNTYVVVVTDSKGCTGLGMGKVEDGTRCLEYRTAITPDGDGRNEEFVIGCLSRFSKNRLEIYNRWGQLVYFTDNYNDSILWRGTTLRGNEVPEGTYFFVFQYTDTVTNQTGQKKGSVTVLRQ